MGRSRGEGRHRGARHLGRLCSEGQGIGRFVGVHLVGVRDRVHLGRHDRGLDVPDGGRILDLASQRGEHALCVGDDLGTLDSHAVHQPAGNRQLGVEQRPADEVGIRRLGAAHGIGLLECVEALLRGGGVQPGEVLRRVAHMGIRPVDHGHHLAVGHQHVLGCEVAVHRGGAEPPEGDVLQGAFPAAEEHGWHLAGAGGVVHLGEPARPVGGGVVDREPGIGDEGAVQLVDGGDGAAEGDGGTRSGPQRAEVQVAARQLAVDHHAPPLGEGREAPGIDDVEGKGGVGDGDELAEHLGLRVQGDGRRGVQRSLHHPVAAGVVEHAAVAVVRGGALRCAGGHDIEPGDRHRGEGSELEGRISGHGTTVTRSRVGWGRPTPPGKVAQVVHMPVRRTGAGGEPAASVQRGAHGGCAAGGER